MELVVDANIIISALIKSDGETRALLFCNNAKLYAPEFLLQEIQKHEKVIIKKAELNKQEFELALTIISSRINFIPVVEFKEFIKEAKLICPDENDTEYFALAISKQTPIWTNDKELKNQNEVKIINTKELAEKLKQF